MPRLFLGQRLFDAAMAPLTLLRREALFASLLDTSGVRAGEHVIDAGSGTGWLTRRIAARVGERGSVLGVEPNERSVEFSQRRRGSSIERYVQGDIRALPAPTDAADRVISSLVVHHVEPDEHAATFAELARVLRGGGTLFVIEIARPTTRWARLAFGWHGCVRAALPEPRLRELSREAGFIDVATGTTAPWVRWLRATKP